MSGETLTITAPRRMTVLGRPVRTYSVGRYYDPQTGQFISVDPAVDQTEAPYVYGADDPIDNTDPTGLFCIGDVCTHSFDPMASLDAWINIGRGATFGLTDRIANWIEPGASCTVPQNSLDQFLGQVASTVLAGEFLRSARFGDFLFKSRFLGADSRLFGSEGLGQDLQQSGLLNPPGGGLWRIGWGVMDFGGKVFGPVFRIKIFGFHFAELFEPSRFVP